MNSTIIALKRKDCYKWFQKGGWSELRIIPGALSSVMRNGTDSVGAQKLEIEDLVMLA
jgi:hypothetical protein